jgi:hypothetical protein
LKHIWITIKYIGSIFRACYGAQANYKIIKHAFSCSFKYMYKTFLKHAPKLLQVWFNYAPDMLQICFICDPDMLKKCFIHVFERTPCNMLQICNIILQQFSGKFLKYAPKMLQVWLNCAPDMLQMCLKYAPNVQNNIGAIFRGCMFTFIIFPASLKKTLLPFPLRLSFIPLSVSAPFHFRPFPDWWELQIIPDSFIPSSGVPI